ncbi:YtxH domain-containing protein [Actinoallomurus sp. CA-142502]|uniref:YtxH domain-containing protein n=1 Tax=Actinoallomurus sp. CA-142502 TaxID=3239885 RepID=UPI003D935AE7
MKYRFGFLTGAAVGYVLGTHAGRERYEQIKRLSRRVAENPTVQEAAGILRARASELAGTARQKVGDKVYDRVPGIRRNRQDTAGIS